jgi:predicted nucleic acid-binding protein
MTTPWLIDTNILIYSYDETQELHSSSYAFLEHAFSGHISASIAQQNLLEFLAVVTNPKRVEYPLSPDEALEKIAVYVANFPLVSPSARTFLTFVDLFSRYPSIRERIFDLYLAATALDNGISQISTWNVKHFKTVSELTVKTPEEILTSLRK